MPPKSAFQSRYGITIRGSLSKEQVQYIDDWLSVLPPAMIQSVAVISLQDEEEHYASTFESAHCHWNNFICIRSPWLTSFILWHEVGHAYHFALNAHGSDFERKWREVAGNFYGRSKRNLLYPQNGILTSYGSTSYCEDIAEWVEDVYCFLNEHFSILALLKKTDQLQQIRYFQKLDLLHDYGFITDENYQKIMN